VISNDLWAKIKSGQTLKKLLQPRLAGHVNQSVFKVEKRFDLKGSEYGQQLYSDRLNNDERPF